MGQATVPRLDGLVHRHGILVDFAVFLARHLNHSPVGRIKLHGQDDIIRLQSGGVAHRNVLDLLGNTLGLLVASHPNFLHVSLLALRKVGNALDWREGTFGVIIDNLITGRALSLAYLALRVLVLQSSVLKAFHLLNSQSRLLKGCY